MDKLALLQLFLDKWNLNPHFAPAMMEHLVQRYGIEQLQKLIAENSIVVSAQVA